MRKNSKVDFVSFGYILLYLLDSRSIVISTCAMKAREFDSQLRQMKNVKSLVSIIKCAKVYIIGVITGIKLSGPGGIVCKFEEDGVTTKALPEPQPSFWMKQGSGNRYFF